jgi:dienelactone hydrolase
VIGRTTRGIIALASIAAIGLTAAPAASAQVTTAFDGANACTPLSGADAGRFSCGGIVETWDGTTPIDTNLFLPSSNPPTTGFPLIGVYHGWGGSKLGLNARLRSYLNRGYAVFSISDRGWGLSCGGTDLKRLTPACADGYNHLMDTRYEVRDAQYLMGLLVDDGIADPQRIGATGGSYGGGMSMSLAALKNRVMLPNDTLVDWESPDGTNIELAGATPEIPWTDLAYSLQPNGATLDYAADSPYRGPNGDKRIGVLKQSFVAGLYATGLATSNYALPGTDPDADLTTWYSSINAGEPYDTNPLAADIVDEIQTHHSSYYINDSSPPAPLLISNGWTDDLFPADEAIRFYNRTRAEHPSADISLYFMDYGHQRGRNASGDRALLDAAQDAWLDHHVLGTAPAPPEDVTTLPQVCNGANPSGAEISAPSWAAIAPGEVRFEGTDLQVIAPAGGNPAAGQAFDPIAGGGACATTDAADAPGIANYRLPAAPAAGYTLIGAPTIIADVFSPGVNNQIAARLVDVDTVSGEQTLVARGLFRPKLQPVGGVTPIREVFQLHPNRWHFAAGHVPKLELLPADQPYGRNSNGQGPITVEGLELRIPVAESPGGVVQAPADKVLPNGYDLAPGYAANDDADSDGWPDDADNCPGASNPTQVDSDGDGTGDACDAVDDDADNDGVVDTADNCPSDSNPGQSDSDDDGIGDVCDPSDNDDLDGDGVENDADNCPDDSNPGQQDGDGDGLGNACDPIDNDDLDDDGVDDAGDNCPSAANPGQQDTDGDGIGNACDPQNGLDRDDDSVPNPSDNCPDDANPSQQNNDGDLQGDVCDADDDNDGVLDTADSCAHQAGLGADGCPPSSIQTPGVNPGTTPVTPGTTPATPVPGTAKKCTKRKKAKAKRAKKKRRCKKKPKKRR